MKKTMMRKGNPKAGARARFMRGIRGTDPILKDPRLTVAFVGRSNVGKSSAVNAILGAELARPSATPGKTQEINYYLYRDRAYLADLPGYGYAKMPAKLAEKLRKLILWYLTSGEARITVVVLVIDACVGLTEFDREMITLLREVELPYIILANKIDKLNQKEFAERFRTLSGEVADASVLPFSAKAKKGVREARAQLFGE
jgi:GTP-binding protein